MTSDQSLSDRMLFREAECSVVLGTARLNFSGIPLGLPSGQPCRFCLVSSWWTREPSHLAEDLGGILAKSYPESKLILKIP